MVVLAVFTYPDLWINVCVWGGCSPASSRLLWLGLPFNPKQQKLCTHVQQLNTALYILSREILIILHPLSTDGVSWGRVALELLFVCPSFYLYDLNSIRKPNFGSLSLIYDVRRSAVDRIFPFSYCACAKVTIALNRGRENTIDRWSLHIIYQSKFKIWFTKMNPD